MYTGVDEDGRQHLELTAVTVDVRIDERVARRRADQIFTNHIYYVYRLVTAEAVQTRKLTLLR